MKIKCVAHVFLVLAPPEQCSRWKIYFNGLKAICHASVRFLSKSPAGEISNCDVMQQKQRHLSQTWWERIQPILSCKSNAIRNPSSQSFEVVYNIIFAMVYEREHFPLTEVWSLDLGTIAPLANLVFKWNAQKYPFLTYVYLIFVLCIPRMRHVEA